MITKVIFGIQTFFYSNKFSAVLESFLNNVALLPVNITYHICCKRIYINFNNIYFGIFIVYY